MFNRNVQNEKIYCIKQNKSIHKDTASFVNGEKKREIRNKREYYFLDHNLSLCIYCFNINHTNSYYNKYNKKI